MFRCYFRRLCTIVVSLMLVVMLASYKPNHQTNNSMETTSATRLQCNNNNQTLGMVRRRPSSSFFVFSPQCKIPYVDPFAKDLLKWEPLKLKSCTDGPSLFGVTYDRDRRQYRVILDKTVAEKHFASYSPFGCTYIEINPGSEKSSADSRPMNFNPDWVVPSHFQGMIVECHAMADTSRVMQRDAFSFVQQPRNRRRWLNATRDAMKPSILIFGIGSMSRMNFRRTMPLTSQFVGQEGWFELEGYNSVSRNRVKNLMAILSGRTWPGDLTQPSHLYGLTLLWQRFRNAGYLTAYAEDVTSDYFEPLKMGFSRLPVDFYFRPFLVVLEKVFKAVEYLGLCMGRKRRFRYVLDFAKQLIERFVFEQQNQLFGLFWTSSLTQDDFRAGRSLDEPFVRYLEEFQELGLFDRAIVILVSDHGSSRGLLADHPTGFLEERLPMLHIYLPPWYRERYPSVEKALRLNRNRLSSNCDLHLGVRQFIEQARPGIRFVETFYTCRSILKELPKDRSCRNAFIPADWCTCEPFLGVPVGDSVRSTASLVVYRMNKYLRGQDLAKECHRLVLDRVLRAELLLHFDELGKRVPTPDGIDTYRLLFTVKPSGTTFWSMVQSSNDSDVVSLQLEGIRRLGLQKNTSLCVTGEMAKKFCICRNS